MPERVFFHQNFFVCIKHWHKFTKTIIDKFILLCYNIFAVKGKIKILARIIIKEKIYERSKIFR